MNNGQLTILHKDNLQNVIVQDGVKWTTARQGEPGKLSFTIVKTDDLEIEEGDRVSFLWNDAKVFYGFLFSRSTNKQGDYECVAYDQIRYLKNKDTFMFKDADAGQIFVALANTFGLSIGEIYIPPYKYNSVEDNSSGLDIVGKFCDQVMLNLQRMYVLYDDFGKLYFKEIESQMSVPYLLDQNNAEDFEYTVSIDNGAYNRIKFVTKNGQYYIEEDQANLFQWGLLQLYQKVEQIPDREQTIQILGAYDRPTKTLKVKDAFGDIRVRAGTWIPVNINVNNEIINYPLIVEKVTHTFEADSYTMELTLVGGRGFVA